MTKISPIELPYMTELFPVVSIHDEAIDKTKSNLARYQKTRDMSHLEFYPDRKPTIYHLKLMKTHVLTALVDQSFGVNAMRTVFFCYCVKRIENFTDALGATFTQWEPNHQLPDGTKVIDDSGSKLDELIADRRVLYEIGDVAYWRNFLHRDKSPEYPALHISTARITAR